jgi:hypothetical protein
LDPKILKTDPKGTQRRKVEKQEFLSLRAKSKICALVNNGMDLENSFDANLS